MSEGYVSLLIQQNLLLLSFFIFHLLSVSPPGWFSSDALDELQLKRYCCRRMVLTHVDLIEKLLHYNRACLVSAAKNIHTYVQLCSYRPDCFFHASYGENEGSGPIPRRTAVEALFLPVYRCQQVPSLSLNNFFSLGFPQKIFFLCLQCDNDAYIH